MRKYTKMKLRGLALILTLAILLSAFPISATLASNGASGLVSDDFSGVTVLHNGAEKSSITVQRDGAETLTAFTADVVPDTRTWQIRIPDTDSWVNIYGQSGEALTVTYALIGSMLNSNDCAYIRVTITVGDKSYSSNPVEVKAVHSVSEELPAETPALMMARSSAQASDDTNFETFTIVINYIFDNGGLAFEPYGASVAKNSNFYAEVKSPTVAGYAPFMRVGNEYVDASTVVLNYAPITENITINVIYEPTIVEYKVHHHFQGLYDDDYSLQPDRTTTAKGLTNSIIPDGLALTAEELPGFTALAYEKLTVAADGSTVVEIRYNRNYYLINFEMNGGYGTDPVYTRFGSLVGANAPTRHGYIFDGWEMISYNGQAPTTEQASMYDINVGTITVPDANIVFRARWITQVVKYTMVFWKENINDNGFSYWGCIDNLSAHSGSTVSGADKISEISGIDDEKYFTYNDALTDKDVLVEGDGSTIVNVYYTRNRYTVTFKAPGKCVIPVGHTHTDSCYALICTKGHVHTNECTPKLTCTKTEHTEHTAECIKCGMTAHTHSSSCCGYTEHTHSTSCFNNVGNASTPSKAPTGVEDGYIYRSGQYYIYIAGSWYRYTGKNASSGDVVDPTCGKSNHTHGTSGCACSLTPHTHTDNCYRDSLHAHDTDKCYSYSCGSSNHVHVDGCRILNCGVPTGHTHTTSCNSSSSTNTVKIVYRKYQESLESIWPVTDDNGKTYNSGERWKPATGSATYSEVLVFISSMPGENLTLTLDKSSNDTYTMNYYLQVLNGEAYDVAYNGRYYKLYTTVKANYNYITSAEDFFDIHGFKQQESNPSFKSGQIDINGGGTVNFYYVRVTNRLDFSNNGTILGNKTQYNIPYGQSLQQYNFVPDYPENLEPGAYTFGGWYTSYNCFDGTEVNWDTITMDADNVMLYAKWSYVTHTVEVYLDNTLTTQIGNTQYVSHNNFASIPVETVTNGNYVFQGWFYKDIVDGKVEEKAFVFTGIPVVDDMKIYAKWSSHVSVNYTINYVLKNTGEIIAPPTVGSAIAGNNKTFYAKAGDDLNVGFREGYYPLTSSHTVTMSAESDHEYTFEYVFVPSMPYLVKYVDESGKNIIAPKKVLDNNLSVVTETFEKVAGYMPDAYQKRLILSASGDDSDNDGILDQNVITFIYNSDSVHAYYRVVHYIENINKDGYREYRSEETVGNIGEAYTLSAISITGFSFNGQKVRINGTTTPVNGSTVTQTLTSEGLLIEFYYDRVEVSYTVKYLEQNTNKVLYADKIGEGIFGEQIIEFAPGLTHLGYSLVSDSVKDIHLSANEESNVIIFYYQETTYSLRYRIVGATDGANLSISSENISAVSGQPNGSQPYVSSGYHLVGWYYDEACTKPVPMEWVDDETGKITPQSNGVWLASHTYFAMVNPDFTSLTISTLGCSDVDENQVFIFNVKGVSGNCNSIDLNVTVVGNSSVSVDHLPIGSYTVTEITDWSYRYTPDNTSKGIQLSVDKTKNTLTFSHIRSKTKWIDGSAEAKNKFN